MESRCQTNTCTPKHGIAWLNVDQVPGCALTGLNGLCVQGGADPGTLPPNLASSGHMAPAMPEAALYTQLTHHYRLLDPALALSRCKDDAEKLEAQK